MNFNELVRNKMQELNLTGYKLSQQSGVIGTLIYGIVNDTITRPRLDTVIKLAIELDIDLNLLKED